MNKDEAKEEDTLVKKDCSPNLDMLGSVTDEKTQVPETLNPIPHAAIGGRTSSVEA